MKNLVSNNRMKHVAIVLLLVFCFTFLIGGWGSLSDSPYSVYASSSSSPSSSSEDEADDYDLYNVSSDAAGAFQDALGGALTEDEEEDEYDGDGSPKAAKMLEPASDAHILTGNVGTYLGFVDEKKSDIQIESLFSAKRTQASVSFSYKQFRRMREIITGSGSGAYGFMSYANYGRMLADLGLDTTAATGSFSRKAVGYPLMAAYLLAASVPYLFMYISKFLQMLNPFVLLGEGANKLASSNSSLSELGKWTSNLWDMLHDLSLFVIIPLFFAFSFGIALIGHQPGGKSEIKDSIFKFAIRLVFITLAIPITGAIYSSFLDQLGTLSGYGTGAADSVVYSELIDFQGWASYSRLSPPPGVDLVWDMDKEMAVIPKGSIRTTAKQVNEMADHIASDASESSYRKTDIIPSGFGMYDLSKVEYTAGGRRKDLANTKAMALLKRYASGDVYSSSAFASEVNADRQALMTKNDEDKEKYEKMFLEGDVGDGVPAYSATSDSIFGNGILACSSDTETGRATYNVGSAPPQATDFNRVTDAGGLSTVAMYNYLNSKFNDSEVTVYSSKKSTSEYVKDSHYSVSAIGTGVWRVLWYAQALVTLFCMAIIGLIYAVSIVLVGLRQGFKLLTAVPGATLGSMAFIGRFVAAFFVMISDILITIVLYSVFCELLQVVVDATSNIMPASFETAGTVLMGDSAMTPLMVGFSPLNLIGVLFSILLILFVTIFAIRNRVVFIHSVDEVVSGAIGRMLGVKRDVGRGSKGSFLKTAAGTAAGAAIGGAVASKVVGAAGAAGAAGADGLGGGGAKGAWGAAGADGTDGAGGGLLSSAGERLDGLVSGGEVASESGAASVESGSASGFGSSEGGRLSSDGGAFSSEGAEVSGTSSNSTVSAVDNLDNVDAETGVMSAPAGEAKSASGGSVGSTSGEAKSAVGGSTRSAGGSSASIEPGGASSGSLGKMPDPSNPKAAALYQSADAVADKINDTGGAASGMKGFVSGMESSEFKDGKFTGNAGQLAAVANRGAHAADFVKKYNGADQSFKDANKQKFQNAQKQMAMAQHVLGKSGVTSASGQNIMSATQWRTTSANLASAYRNHVDQKRVDQKQGPQRASGRQARPQTGGQRQAGQRSRGGPNR